MACTSQECAWALQGVTSGDVIGLSPFDSSMCCDHQCAKALELQLQTVLQHLLFLQSRLQLTSEAENMLLDLDQQLRLTSASPDNADTCAIKASDKGRVAARASGSSKGPELQGFCQQMLARLSRCWAAVCACLVISTDLFNYCPQWQSRAMIVMFAFRSQCVGSLHVPAQPIAA